MKALRDLRFTVHAHAMYAPLLVHSHLSHAVQFMQTLT